MHLGSDDRHLLPVKSELKCAWGLLVKTHLLNTVVTAFLRVFYCFFTGFYGFFKPGFLARGQSMGFYV